MMKIYQGFATAGHEVNVADRFVIRRLKHRVRHSPTGYCWGYGGSGPADLALSILWDYLSYEPHPALYQQFKWDYIAKWDMCRDWILSSEAIDAWLELNKELPRKAA